MFVLIFATRITTQQEERALIHKHMKHYSEVDPTTFGEYVSGNESNKVSMYISTLSITCLIF